MALTEYIGERYVPQFPEGSEIWDSSKSYEPLTMVRWTTPEDQGGYSAVYVSKTYVPANVSVWNTRYWSQFSGPEGPVGPQGPQGPKGEPGAGLTIISGNLGPYVFEQDETDFFSKRITITEHENISACMNVFFEVPLGANIPEANKRDRMDLTLYAGKEQGQFGQRTRMFVTFKGREFKYEISCLRIGEKLTLIVQAQLSAGGVINANELPFSSFRLNLITTSS